MRFFSKKKRSESAYRFNDVGFHGDKYLLALVDAIMQKEISYFIETGTNVGSTLAYVARTYPHVQCLSCEPDHEAFKRATQNCSLYMNIALYNMTSQKFMECLRSERPEIFRDQCLFWLDAHGYGFTWPLKDEITFVTTTMKKGYVLIDDFKVPHIDSFGFDEYDDQTCSYEFIKDAFATEKYRLYYPNYRDRTSAHHPLRGWGLFVLGDYFSVPPYLADKVILSSQK